MYFDFVSDFDIEFRIFSLTDFNPAIVSEAAPPTRYQAVSAAAVASLVLGDLDGPDLSALDVCSDPLAAIAAGWWALRRIERRPEELTGSQLAWVGIGLAVAFWVLGTG